VSREAVRVAQDRLRWDTPFWARHCATVLTPSKRPVRLEARPWQARTPETPAHMTPLDEALERQRAAGMPMRAIILKARKLGMSTWVQAKLMQRVTQLPFQYCLVAAHRRDAGQQLFDMARLMYRRLPLEADLGFAVKPAWLGGTDVARGGTGYMTLGDRHRPEEASTYEVVTAGGKGGGRGSTPTGFHGSEVAHYEGPEFLVGAVNAVPDEPETIVVLESTASGFNSFYDRWQRAVEGSTDPETGGLYVPLFYGWQDNPFNALPFLSDDARDRFSRTVGDPDGGGDEEEMWLVEQFGVTLEQLRWRRATRDEKCDGKVEVFHQEHPATPEQAFIGSGQPVFGGILIARAIKAAESAHTPVEGVLRPADVVERRTRAGSVLVPQRALWVPAADVTAEDRERWGTGRLVVWEHPVNEVSQQGMQAHERGPDGQYVTFVDPAQGVGTVEDADYSAIQVIDHLSKMQVARYRSRVSIHQLPLLALLIAVYFNESWLAPEKTGLGIGLVETLRQDYRYRLLYRTRRRGDDDRSGPGDHLLGWSTNPQTKPLMEQTFGQALRDDVHGLRDPATAREFTTYVEDPKNPARHGAQKGAHDDLAVCWMGAYRVASELKPRDPSKRRTGRVRGWRPIDPITGA
jgi:hypothetical protein